MEGMAHTGRSRGVGVKGKEAGRGHARVIWRTPRGVHDVWQADERWTAFELSCVGGPGGSVWQMSWKAERCSMRHRNTLYSLHVLSQRMDPN